MPSTRSPGIPYASAFTAIVSEAVCIFTGTEMAHWLFWQTKTAGARQTAVKLSPAWKSA